MKYFQRVVAVTLLVCLVPMPYGGWLDVAQAASLPDPALTKRTVALLSVGARVRMTLANGEKITGSIASVGAESFDVVGALPASQRRLAYHDVSELKLTTTRYRANGVPNALDARRVAATLGVGKFVKVQVASGNTLRGHIETVSEDVMVLRLDRQAGSAAIEYREVQEMTPASGGRGKRIAIWVVALAVAAFVIFSIPDSVGYAGTGPLS